MSGRSRFDLEVDRRVARVRQGLVDDLRRLLEDAGLAQARLASAAGVSPGHLSRILHGDREASIETLARLAEAANAEVSLRLVPGAGLAIHDRFQARMVEAFLGELHPKWAPFPEVPVRTPARGSIDLAFGDRGGRDLVASEFHSQLRRAEQVIRWSNEKAEALRGTELYHAARGAARGAADEDRPPRISRLLVLRSTPAVREVVGSLSATFDAAYPEPADEAVEALRDGKPWPGSAIVWMEVHGREAHLLAGRPRSLRGWRRSLPRQPRDG